MHADRRTPNWVKVSAGTAAVLILLVLLIHLSGIEIPGHSLGDASPPETTGHGTP
jgi:hypothetical protein